MASQNQIRKALNQVSNVAAFVLRHDVAERTIYRQRGDNPPRMRPTVAAKLEAALIEEGLIRGSTKKQPRRNARATSSQRSFNVRSRAVA